MAVPSCVETITDMDSPGSRAPEGTAHTSKPPSPSPTLYAAISNEIMATSSVKEKRLIRLCYAVIVILLGLDEVLEWEWDCEQG